jgi:hypothetical protein
VFAAQSGHQYQQRHGIGAAGNGQPYPIFFHFAILKSERKALVYVDTVILPSN